MKYGRYGLPYLFLRIGLGLTFVYIGVDVLRHPEAWLGFVSDEVWFGLTRESLLRLGGVFDLVIGLLLVFRIMTKLAGVLAVLCLLGVFVMNGIDVALVRNLGLLGAALAVAAWPGSYHRKKHWWQRKSKRGGGSSEEE